MKIQSKPLAVLAGAATLVGGVALWPSAAGADPDRDRSGSGKTIEIKAVGDRVEEQFIDNGATGLSLGDEVAYTNRDTLEDGSVANVYGACTAHQVTAATATWNCVATSEGERGALTVQGSIQLENATGRIVGGEGVWAITGGTGEFDRARGVITFTSEGAGLDTVIKGTARVHLR